ncbi:MAG: hypothetical protein ACPLRO_07585, partial [Candidatus Kapaibacteriota bacterium]
MKKLKSLIYLIAFTFTLSNVFCQFTSEEEIKENLPKMLGANNVGKEFWLTIPICFEDESFGFQNFIKIFITSPYRTRVTVEVPVKSYFSSKMTIANDVISFDITPTQG